MFDQMNKMAPPDKDCLSSSLKQNIGEILGVARGAKGESLREVCGNLPLHMNPSTLLSFERGEFSDRAAWLFILLSYYQLVPDFTISSLMGHRDQQELIFNTNAKIQELIGVLRDIAAPERDGIIDAFIGLIGSMKDTSPQREAGPNEE